MSARIALATEPVAKDGAVADDVFRCERRGNVVGGCTVGDVELHLGPDRSAGVDLGVDPSVDLAPDRTCCEQHQQDEQDDPEDPTPTGAITDPVAVVHVVSGIDKRICGRVVFKYVFDAVGIDPGNDDSTGWGDVIGEGDRGLRIEDGDPRVRRRAGRRTTRYGHGNSGGPTTLRARSGGSFGFGLICRGTFTSDERR